MRVKVIKEAIDDESAQGFAGDVGFLWKSKDEDTNIGLLFNNMGSKMKFKEKGYPLPFTIRMGISLRLKVNPQLERTNIITFLVDGSMPRDNDISGHIGIEYAIRKIKDFQLFFRAGYKTTTMSDLDTLSGMSAGVGFSIGDVGIDYAWVPYGDLGDTHRISLSKRTGWRISSLDSRATSWR